MTVCVSAAERLLASSRHRQCSLLVTRTLAQCTMEVEPNGIATNLARILQQIDNVYNDTSPNTRWTTKPRLVAVSKVQHASKVRSAYTAGQRHFGENYPQELIEKAQDPLLSEQCCPGLRWRFIGTLQSNKVPKLIGSVQNLDAIESVSSIKLADLLQGACERRRLEQSGPLHVLIQVNTSGEPEKSGVDSAEDQTIDQLAGHIMTKCDRLRFAGFMTIGALARSQAAQQTGDNEDFELLSSVRQRFLSRDTWTRHCGSLQPSDVELSMGMSADFEAAIACGASSVRVGSAIFGVRA